MSTIIGSRVFRFITEEQISLIVNNYTLTFSELEKLTGLCDTTIKRVIKEKGIVRERLYHRKLDYSNPEVIKDLENPYLSHTSLGLKYGVSDASISSKRKRLGLGVSAWGKEYRSVLEEEIAGILKELDYTFFTGHRLEQWSIDFYLGNKTCIDVNGTWIHNREEVRERDARKEIWMRENGYRYLHIPESEMKNAKQTIESFLTGFPWK